MHSIETIRQEVHTAMEELLTVAKVHEGQLFVVGCSTSEICGKKIGTDSHAYNRFKDPVIVEFIQADAGIDIGDTFIGMHMKHVTVPVRLSLKEIGEAHVTACRVRPKSIGGIRAVYNDALL